MPKSAHGGKRIGAGRKPALLPVFIKKFRASESLRKEFMSYLTGDAKQDFAIVLTALRFWSIQSKAKNKKGVKLPDEQ